jgi:hypothetical protein
LSGAGAAGAVRIEVDAFVDPLEYLFICAVNRGRRRAL